MLNGNPAYQEKHREELLNGEAVAMSPASVGHTFVSNNILTIFKNYLKGKICVPIGDGPLVHLTEQDRFVPDFMVVCDRSKIKGSGIYGAPDLVAEVLSPSTSKNDRGHKKDVYERCGVREYWIVSTGERSVEQYLLRDGRLILDAVHTLQPDYMLEMLTEEEKAALVTHFKCSLFDDLDISLEDIFDNL